MAMFPIFMIGLTVGGVLGYVFSAYKKEKPSETRLRILETAVSYTHLTLPTTSRV